MFLGVVMNALTDLQRTEWTKKLQKTAAKYNDLLYEVFCPKIKQYEANICPNDTIIASKFDNSPSQQSIFDKRGTISTSRFSHHDTTVNGPSSPEPKILSRPPITLVSPGRQSFLFQPTMIPFHPDHQAFTSLAPPCLTQASLFYSAHYIPPSHLGVVTSPQQGNYVATMPPLLHMQANSSRPTVVQIPGNEVSRKRKSSNDSEQSRSSVGSPDDMMTNVKPEECSPAQSMDLSDASPPATPLSSVSSPAPIAAMSPQSPPMSSNALPSPQISETCAICSDKATGHHYGVASCEGCKGFFKRSVQNKKVYTCRNLTKDCPMDKRHRNRCQYCRFQKCMNAGMLKEAVREDRAPGGRHKNSLIPQSQVAIKPESIPCKQPRKSLSMASPEPHNSTVPLPEVIEQIMNCDIPDTFDENTCLGCRETELKEKTLGHITQLAEQQVIRSSNWFEKLPLLQDISMLDKDALIKNSWVELMLANLIKDSQELDNRAMLCRKQILDYETAQTTGIGDIMQRVTQMASNFREFDLDNVEFLCMKIIVLLNPDVVGLQDQQLIEELQDSFHTALHNYIMTKAEKDNNRFGHILLRLPELRSIGTKSLERMFMLKFTGQIHPGRVLSELLHSAKR